jgi:hypothetical protein
VSLSRVAVRGISAAVTSAAMGLAGCGAPPRGLASSEGTLLAERPLRRAIDAPRETESSTHALDQGSDVARATLFELLGAVVRGDAHAMRRLLVEEPLAIHSLRLGQRVPAAFTARRREDVVRGLLSAQRAARLPEGLSLRELVDPERVEIESARATFERGTPGGLEPEDLVVRFHVDEQASRAFVAVANQGRGVIIVRIAPEGGHVVGL